MADDIKESSGPFTVLITDDAMKNFRRLGPPAQKRIRQAVIELENFPVVSNVTKLVGKDIWRKRVGDYRILFTVNQTTIVIMIFKIAHRGEVYE